MKRKILTASFCLAFFFCLNSSANAQLPPGTETAIKKLGPIIIKNVAAPVAKLVAKAAWETTKFTVRNSFKGTKFLIKKAIASAL